jgi:small-conductance mechanosensitive channel
LAVRALHLASVKLTLLLALALPALPAAGEEAPRSASPPAATADEVHAAPVVIDGTVLFHVRGVEGYPATRRAREIAARIEEAAADPAISRESLRVEESPVFSLILVDNKSILSVLDADAKLEGIERQALALAYQVRIGEAIDAWRRDRDPAILKRHALIALGATLLFLLALGGGRRLYRRLRALLEERFRPLVHDVQFRKFELLRGEQLWAVLTGLLRLTWAVVIVVAAYLYLHGVLSLFPWTRGFANRLFAILVDPLQTVFRGVIDAVPNLVFLLVLFFIIRFVLKLLRLFFHRVADGTVVLPEFEAEWAWPTFRLVRLLLVVFALIVAYPYIPGSESGAFKGISIFIGVLFSLGSSSLIGNLIAGYSMTYRRTFKAGDRIRVGEHLGDVEQRRLLVTYLRTPKNEEVVIPNSLILNGEIVNYSALAQQQGLILHTTVGIGYETPWRQVEAMLVEAAARTPGLLREPPPFVLQKGLGDFCVTYEINAYCRDPQAMNRIYSDLHRNILDLFNEYGVQIMTPAYECDPAQPKVVPKEQWYAAPAKAPEGGWTRKSGEERRPGP